MRPDGITLFAAEPRWREVAIRAASASGIAVHPVPVVGHRSPTLLAAADASS